MICTASNNPNYARHSPESPVSMGISGSFSAAEVSVALEKASEACGVAEASGAAREDFLGLVFF